MTRRAVRHESGFTLIELMVAMAIMGIILVPIAGGLFVGLRTSDETSYRLAGSNDAQLLSTWLPPDLHSAGNQSGDVVAAPTANTECSGLGNRLRIRWRATEIAGGSATTYVAAYAISQASTGEYRLIRYYCVGGGAASTHVIARNLANSTAAAISTSGTKVTMTITEKSTPTTPTSYTFSVSGYRRTP
ncbi:MAG: prepilin-type N-terminal cleavage/methylation domain-containing protein [Acidimicrobiia bacterium]